MRDGEKQGESLKSRGERFGTVEAELAQTRTSDAPIPCIACGDSRWAFARDGVDIYRPDAGVFKLERCTGCGHIMQIPAPTAEELSEAYSIGYVDYRPAWKERGWPIWKILRTVTTWRRMRRLGRYKMGKLLEVGSGAGDFLFSAHRAGWDACGVEYNRRCAEALRAEAGIDVRPGELRLGLWDHGAFDVVAIWNVLEHVPDPVATLRVVAEYLKRGGVVFIQVPTSYYVQAGRRYDPYWRMLDLPRHLNFFTRSSIAAVCQRAGLEVLKSETSAIDVAWCYLASVHLLVKSSKSKIRRALGLGWGTVSVLGLLPWFAFRACRGQGVEDFVVAVKR